MLHLLFMNKGLYINQCLCPSHVWRNMDKHFSAVYQKKGLEAVLNIAALTLFASLFFTS